MALRTLFADPMLRMLALAVLLAALLPVGEQGRAFAQWLANAAVFVLFLLNGMRISRREIAAGLVNWRFLLPLMLWVFAGMALGGFALSRVADTLLPSAIVIGLLYLGALPSTVQSAISYSSLAGGNIALSILGAALLNIAGVFVTVPVFLALGGTGDGAVGWETIQRIALILLLPFLIGQAIQGHTRRFIERYKPRIAWIDRIVIALTVYVAFSGAVTQGIWGRVGPVEWMWLGVLVALFLAFAHGGAWLFGGLLSLDRHDRIAFLFAGAQKSAAVGVPLATILFVPEIAGFVVVPLLLYHLFQLVIAAPLASRLAASHPAGGD